jgi:thioredoxin-like negative regulator of GroEL
MSSTTLNATNRAQLLASLQSLSLPAHDAGGTVPWIIACLCAGWCNTCEAYRATFDQLAARHPGHHFIWIDIEDQAEVVGDLDIENFPTLLIQHDDTVAFFGTVLPDLQLAERLIMAQMTQSDAALQATAHSSSERREWQAQCNLRTLLEQALA